jgi:hypothetical protein
LDRGGATFVVGAAVWLAPRLEVRAAIADRCVVLGWPLQRGVLAQVLGVG